MQSQCLKSVKQTIYMMINSFEVFGVSNNIAYAISIYSIEFAMVSLAYWSNQKPPSPMGEHQLWDHIAETL